MQLEIEISISLSKLTKMATGARRYPKGVFPE
jgi:hypothetical protein